MSIAISSRVERDVRTLAHANPDREVCGLLVGDRSLIAGHIVAANVADDPARRFELDPAVLIAAHRAMREGGPAIVGHYHSHPNGCAVPSAIDTAMIARVGELWLIVTQGDLRCWRAVAFDRFEHVVLTSARVAPSGLLRQSTATRQRDE